MIDSSKTLSDTHIHLEWTVNEGHPERSELFWSLTYGRQVASIAADTGAEFSKVAESQFAEVNRKVISLVDEVTKNAPAGSEAYVSAIKTAISNANAGYEQFTKTSKQAAEAIESNLNAAVSQFTQAAGKATSAANGAANAA